HSFTGARAGRIATMSQDWPASPRVSRSNSGLADHRPLCDSLHSSLSQKMLYDESVFSVYAPESPEGALISRWSFGEGATIVRRNHARALVGAVEEWLHEERLSVSPYGAADQRRMFTPDRIAIETLMALWLRSDARPGIPSQVTR